MMEGMKSAREAPNGGLLRATLAVMFAQAPSALATSTLVALLTVALLHGVVDPGALTGWLLAVLGISGARLLLAVRYRATPDPDDARWLRHYLAGTALAGASWGALGMLADPAWPVLQQVGVYTILGGMCAGALANNGTLLSAYLAFLIPTLAPLIGRMLLSGDAGLAFLGGVAAVYGGAMVSVALPYARSLARAHALAREKGDLVDRLSTAIDGLEAEVQQRRAAEAELARERRLFLDGPVTVFRWLNDDAWTVCGVSPNVRQLGFDRDQLVFGRTSYRDLIHPEDRPQVVDSEFRRAGPGGELFVEQDYRLLLPDGSTRWVYDYTVPVQDETGRITHLDGYLLDITARKGVEAALVREKELAQVTLQSIGDGVVRTDAVGRVEYLNPVAEHLTGWRDAEARGLSIRQVCPILAEDNREPIELLQPSARPARLGGDHYLLCHRDGSEAAITWTLSPLRARDGLERGAVLVLHDVSETRSLARRLEHQANHDALTGLLNRHAFERRLAQAIDTARRESAAHACMYVDLDQFKVVNDTCGHAAGDELLRQLAARLRAHLRESDALARLGGDEFGVLLEGCPMEHARDIAENLRSAVRDFRFAWTDKTFEVGASIGVVAVTAASPGTQAVLSAADVACYAAKDLGRNRVHVYEEGDLELARRRGEMQYVSRITKALAENRLVLYCQDIVPVSPGIDEPHGMEMLVRMRGEDGALVPPNAFLPAAERYNLMPSIDRWVVRETFGWLAAQPDPTRFEVAVNLSGTTLSEEGFLEYVGEQFAAHGVPPASVCFEITETAAIANFSTASRFIRELRALGCRFALDDFGSGLSSFSYLKNLPVDYLKIDGTFVRDLLEDEVDFAMVRAINDIGHALGIQTIAEFVENRKVLQALRGLGVDYAQGWAIGQPRPLAEVAAEPDHVLRAG
jgi:diguanylate cyclase (GGDEF)-like protein/PAS domain S-box-containing protein